MANMTLVRVTSRVWSQPKLKDYDDPYDLPSIKHGWLRSLLQMAIEWGTSSMHRIVMFVMFDCQRADKSLERPPGFWGPFHELKQC